MWYVLVYVVYVYLIKCVVYGSCIIVKEIMYFQRKQIHMQSLYHSERPVVLWNLIDKI